MIGDAYCILHTSYCVLFLIGTLTQYAIRSTSRYFSNTIIEQKHMQIVDLNEMEGRTFPAQRRTRNLVGGVSPIRSEHFSLGYVVLEPRGGQVPWHNQEQDEIYFIVEGAGEICIGEERQVVRGGQTVFLAPGEFHQLTNVGEEPLTMIYCYGPAGEVAHWRQELDGTLPRAGVEAPPLPEGAWPQCTEASQ